MNDPKFNEEAEMALDPPLSDKDRGRLPLYNTYAAKKTVAQGMMDIALITANANQLRYLVEFQRHSPTFYFTLSLIIISIILQLAVGLFLIFKGRYDLKGEEKLAQANKVNNYVVVGVFLVTVVNVFIASFSISLEPVRQQIPVSTT